MRSKLIFLAIIGWSTACFAVTEKQREVILTLSDGITWKAVFDAGFRPVHVRDGLHKCRQTNVRFGVRLRDGGKVFHLGRGDIEFSLRADYEVVLISFYGRENRTTRYSERNLEEFARIFSDHLRSRGNLGYFKNGRINLQDAESHATVGAFRLAYRLRASFNETEPLLEDVVITPVPGAKRKPPKWLETPIKPPAGYEHLDLRVTTPVVEGTKHGDLPESEEVQGQTQLPLTTKNTPPNQDRNYWWWLIPAIALGVLLYLRARHRKAHSA